jgi:hypothetical protein
MDTQRRTVHWYFVLATAILVYVVACDSFWSIRGVLYECGTEVGIPDADGVAIRVGKPNLEFKTDKNGRFLIQTASPTGAQVAVRFSKAGYVTTSQFFDGEPKNADNVQLCMQRAAP